MNQLSSDVTGFTNTLDTIDARSAQSTCAHTAFVNITALMRGSYSARVPRSSLAKMHREFVHHILEDEVDGQEEGQDDKREDGEQREESGVVEESQNKHMSMNMNHDK